MASIDENERRIKSLYAIIKKLNGELNAISEPTQKKLANAYMNIVDEQLSEAHKDGKEALNIQKNYKNLKDMINGKIMLYSLAIIAVTSLIFGVNEIYVGGLVNAILARIFLIAADGATIIYCSNDIIKEFNKMQKLETAFKNNPIVKTLSNIDICDCNLKKHIEFSLLKNKEETHNVVADKKKNLITKANMAIINARIDECQRMIDTILTSMTPKEYEEMQKRIPALPNIEAINQNNYNDELSLTK